MSARASKRVRPYQPRAENDDAEDDAQRQQEQEEEKEEEKEKAEERRLLRQLEQRMELRTVRELRVRYAGLDREENAVGRGAGGVVYRVRARGHEVAVKAVSVPQTPPFARAERVRFLAALLAQIEAVQAAACAPLGEEEEEEQEAAASGSETPQWTLDARAECALVPYAALWRTPRWERVYLEMPYAARGDLARWLRDERPSFARRLALLRANFRPLVSTLLRMHERGVLHRDIKPQNLLAVAPPARAEEEEDEEPLPRLYYADFDAACALPRCAGSAIVGTNGYADPLLVLGFEGRRALPISDTYALGMTLWVVLTDASPEAVPLRALQALARDPRNPERLRALQSAFRAFYRERVRPLLQEVVARHLRAQPEDRWALFLQRAVAAMTLPFNEPPRRPALRALLRAFERSFGGGA